MTVEKVVRKQGKTGNSKKVQKKNEFSFTFLDNLMEKIDTLEDEEEVSKLFEEEELLTKSFQSLMNLMKDEASQLETEVNGDEEDFDSEKIDEKVMEIMSKLLDEGIVEEEEFEDFFTEDFNEEETEETESEESGESEESESEESEEESKISLKSSKEVPKKEKKSKHLRELEMLMEKVDDESDLDDEFETEEDEESADEEFDNFDDDEEEEQEGFVGKKDIFEEDKGEVGRLSSFEKAQAALKAQISALESENIQEQRPWALRGEINARQRPSDSLLEEAVDFDNLSRPTPQITEERTEEIEDIIKRRIGEAAWDDVERKDGRDLTLLNGMQTSTQKSPRALLEDVATAAPQKSLTQVYEDDAQTKLTGSSPQDEETLQKQTELTALFAKICRHIDGLSGNRFAPKIYVQSDFQIKTLSVKK